jgi:hypothetical protein
MKTYKVEVIADSTGNWCGNDKVFHDASSAEEWARDLFMRWTLVREWRVIDDTSAVIVASRS